MPTFSLLLGVTAVYVHLTLLCNHRPFPSSLFDFFAAMVRT